MVYVFLANGFEDIEAVGTIDILRRANVDVKTVGIGAMTVRSAHGITFAADIGAGDLTTDFDMIVLPGGMPGTLMLEKSATVQKMIDIALEKDKLIAAICAAPSILGHKGILKGKKCVCYPGFEKELLGAEVLKCKAVADGKIITANGPGAVFDFANEILKALGRNTEKVMSSMGLKF